MCDNFKKTTFITVYVPLTLNSGKPIGNGECKAVRLKLNAFGRNSTALVNGSTACYIYYGDALSQEVELWSGSSSAVVSSGGWSPLIYCTDLNQVWVRRGIGAAGLGTHVQVQIYQ